MISALIIAPNVPAEATIEHDDGRRATLEIVGASAGALVKVLMSNLQSTRPAYTRFKHDEYSLNGSGVQLLALLLFSVVSTTREPSSLKTERHSPLIWSFPTFKHATGILLRALTVYNASTCCWRVALI